MDGTEVEATGDGVSKASTEPAARMEELVRDLLGVREALRGAETRSLIIRALAGAAAVDLDAAMTMVERALPASEAGADARAIKIAVDELRRQRPGMFRSSVGSRASTMSARIERMKPTVVEEAAAEAVRSGDRMSLLHYLRLKRRV